MHTVEGGKSGVAPLDHGPAATTAEIECEQPEWAPGMPPALAAQMLFHAIVFGQRSLVGDAHLLHMAQIGRKILRAREEQFEQQLATRGLSMRGAPQPAPQFPLAFGGDGVHQAVGLATAPFRPARGQAFGGQSLQQDPFSGVRVTLGLWCDACHDFGIEGSFFSLFQQSSRFSATSGGTPVLARPFFNAGTANEDAELIAFPNLLAGSANIALTTRLLGAEANLRANLCKGCCYRVDFLAGFRFLALDESLNINEALQTLQVAGGGFRVWDGFGANNRFYGGQVGLDTELRRGRWFLDLKSKIALGSNNQVVNINGNTITTDPRTGTSTLTGGLLALSTNSGRFTREMFAVAPEGTINLGYQICDNVRAYVGYNFLYISDVARPANLIDRAVNTSFLPPATPSLPVRPAFVFKGTDFWAQGLNFGLEFRY